MVIRAVFTCLITISLCTGCRDDRAPHVFHTPAPSPAVTPAPTASPAAPEVPFGSTAADARITSVTDATTGGPVALTDIGDSIVVLAMMARGPAWSAREALEARLVIHGACEGVVSTSYPAPAPVVMAQQFRLVFAPGHIACSRSGQSAVRVLLVGAGGRVLASSVALSLSTTRGPESRQR